MFEVSDVDKFLDKLDRVQEDLSEEIEKEIFNLSYNILERVVMRSPYDGYGEDLNGGDIKQGWQIGPLVEDEEGWHSRVYNDLPNSKYAEYGYRTEDGKYIPGVHMLRISLQEIMEDMDSNIKKSMREFWRGEFNDNL